MNITTRLIIITTIIVALTDTLEYIHLKQHPEHFTIKYLILVIVVTVVPLAINIWFHMRIQK
jgi:hypothetical protein